MVLIYFFPPSPSSSFLSLTVLCAVRIVRPFFFYVRRHRNIPIRTTHPRLLVSLCSVAAIWPWRLTILHNDRIIAVSRRQDSEYNKYHYTPYHNVRCTCHALSSPPCYYIDSEAILASVNSVLHLSFRLAVALEEMPMMPMVSNCIDVSGMLWYFFLPVWYPCTYYPCCMYKPIAIGHFPA